MLLGYGKLATEKLVDFSSKRDGMLYLRDRVA
jgi:hypothetical protein